MNLSPHFTLQEMTVSESAARMGLKNEPSATTIKNLEKLCAVLEAVRALLGVPLIITSGYRCRELNKAINGSPTSMHCLGLAADFIAPDLAVIDACKRIAESAIGFDQLIYEFTWVHLGLGVDRERREILTRRSGRYLPGIV